MVKTNAKVTNANTTVNIIHTTFGVSQPVLSSIVEPSLTTNNAENNSHVASMLNIYYFHPDHLGSSSYITNKAGVVTQHMEYLPFGETMVDEHLNSNNSPFKFNGKEFDEEMRSIQRPQKQIKASEINRKLLLQSALLRPEIKYLY